MTKSAFQAGRQMIRMYDKLNVRRREFYTMVKYAGVDLTEHMKHLQNRRDVLDKLWDRCGELYRDEIVQFAKGFCGEYKEY